jgi:ABC-type polar amino acid transport system ATPase subunit
MVTPQVHARPVGALAPTEAALSAQNISLARGNQLILSDVSLSLQPGEITALIGPSGAGKTTLLKALSLLETPDSGHLKIDEYNYSFPLRKGEKWAPPWPKVTVVFQQLFLWPHLTLRQNITLPLGKKPDPGTTEFLEHLIDRFQMRHFIDRYPNQASIGQRQRAALVRAMVLNPKYILLDEITSSLDVEQVALILSEIRLLRERGVGILLITHLLHFAREAADSVVFLEGGRVIESGGKEVLTKPKEERVKAFLAMAELAS